MEGYASLQALPFSSIEPGRSGPFSRQVVTEEEPFSISLLRSGLEKGGTCPDNASYGCDFQDAANTAVFVAQQETGVSLSGSDVIFSITADHEIPGVDGSSAGALMTLLTVAAINGTELNDSVTLTGTIDAAGNVGAIGGVFESRSIRSRRKNSLPSAPGNSELVIYKLVERRVGGFTIVERFRKSWMLKTTLKTRWILMSSMWTQLMMCSGMQCEAEMPHARGG